MVGKSLNIIYGRKPVENLIKSKNRKIKRIFLLKNFSDNNIITLINRKEIKTELVTVEELNRLTSNRNHQGIVAEVEGEFKYTELDELLQKVENKDNSTLVILDGIEDPVNFGSIIRTSSCFSVDGIIISKNRQVQVTSTVSKVATGAEEYVPICRVTNLNQTIATLKKNGFWIVTTDGWAKTLYTDVDYNGKIAVIIGSEGKGASKLVASNSDFVVKIPISGPITSLNASIACAIVLAQITNYRLKK